MQGRTSAINTALLSCVLGVTGWVAYKASSSGEAIAGMQATSSAVVERLGRVEAALGNMVPRHEAESRILRIESDQRSIEVRLREIDLEILKLKQKSGI